MNPWLAAGLGGLLVWCAMKRTARLEALRARAAALRAGAQVVAAAETDGPALGPAYEECAC